MFLDSALMLLRDDVIVPNPALGVDRRNALIADIVSQRAVAIEIEIEVIAE